MNGKLKIILRKKENFFWTIEKKTNETGRSLMINKQNKKSDVYISINIPIRTVK